MNLPNMVPPRAVYYPEQVKTALQGMQNDAADAVDEVLKARADRNFKWNSEQIADFQGRLEGITGQVNLIRSHLK